MRQILNYESIKIIYFDLILRFIVKNYFEERIRCLFNEYSPLSVCMHCEKPLWAILGPSAEPTTRRAGSCKKCRTFCWRPDSGRVSGTDISTSREECARLTKYKKKWKPHILPKNNGNNLYLTHLLNRGSCIQVLQIILY